MSFTIKYDYFSRPLSISEYQIVNQNDVLLTDDSSDSDDDREVEKKRFDYIRNNNQ